MGEGENRELLLNGFRVSVWSDEKVLETVAKVAKHSKCN